MNELLLQLVYSAHSNPLSQDYLICIEMFLGSIVHQYVFHHTDYSNNKFTDLHRGGEKRRRRVVGRRRKGRKVIMSL